VSTAPLQISTPWAADASASELICKFHARPLNRVCQITAHFSEGAAPPCKYPTDRRGIGRNAVNLADGQPSGSLAITRHHARTLTGSLTANGDVVAGIDDRSTLAWVATSSDTTACAPYPGHGFEPACRIHRVPMAVLIMVPAALSADDGGAAWMPIPMRSGVGRSAASVRLTGQILTWRCAASSAWRHPPIAGPCRTAP
jgi:hypothetical protein